LPSNLVPPKHIQVCQRNLENKSLSTNFPFLVQILSEVKYVSQNAREEPKITLCLTSDKRREGKITRDKCRLRPVARPSVVQLPIVWGVEREGSPKGAGGGGDEWKSGSLCLSSK